MPEVCEPLSPPRYFFFVQLAAADGKAYRSAQKKVVRAAARLHKYEQRLVEVTAKKVGWHGAKNVWHGFSRVHGSSSGPFLFWQTEAAAS